MKFWAGYVVGTIVGIISMLAYPFVRNIIEEILK